MRFSVLLPTRNGGALLGDCIESVLEQNFDDFELVISDNANTDSTPDVIRRFAGDSRLKVVRQETVLPVTENWTAALRASSGEYVLLVGDDDYLLPDALRRLDEIIRRHRNPDCVLYNGYFYVSPTAVATDPTSYWRPHFDYGPEFVAEGVLSMDQRLGIVRDMFRFQQRVPLNMQTMVFARTAIERESQSKFVEPFPDHYLVNALLIGGRSCVYAPDQLVICGVSPNSFGHYYYSHRVGDGLTYLGVSVEFQGSLPGSALLNGMYRWLMKLKDRYPDALRGVEIDRASYVRRQIHAWLLQGRYGGITKGQLAGRFAGLSLRDWIGLLGTVADGESWRRLVRLFKTRRKTQMQAMFEGMMAPLPGIANIRDFSKWARRQQNPAPEPGL